MDFEANPKTIKDKSVNYFPGQTRSKSDLDRPEQPGRKRAAQLSAVGYNLLPGNTPTHPCLIFLTIKLKQIYFKTSDVSYFNNLRRICAISLTVVLLLTFLSGFLF